MSPESNRTPSSRSPEARRRRPTSIACSTPAMVSYVSTSSSALCGITSAYRSNASRSESNAMTQLWACVPFTGIPYRLPASTFEVPVQPPT